MSANTFLAKLSELSGDRFDPQMVLYNRKTNAFKYPTFPLKHFLYASPMYGANEPGIIRKNADEPRYIRITDIDEFGNLNEDTGATAENIEDKYYLDENDLLFARSGATVGKTYLHKSKTYPCFFAGYMIKFKIDPAKINPYFVFTYTQLNTYKEWVKAVQRASAQPNINAEEYKNFPIPLPPLDIQSQIIAKMDEAYRQKADNEARAQAILDGIDGYLLSELGITTPDIDDKALAKRVFTRKMSEVAGDRFDPYFYQTSFEAFEDCLQKGKFPLFNIGSLTTFIASGSTPRAGGDDYEENGKYHFIRLVNFTSDLEVDLTDSYFVKEAIYNGMLKRSQLQEGDVLFGIAGSIGKIAIYAHKNKAVINQAIALLRFSSGVNHLFVAYILNSIIGQHQIKRLQRPVAQPNLNTEELKSIKIPLPSYEQQNKLVNHIESLRAEAKRLRDEAAQQFEAAKAEVEKMILGN